MRLYGYSGAANPAQTQEIRDNDSYEVYASQYSFPIYFRYNMIEDDDNIGGEEDALVYYNTGTGGITLKDVYSRKTGLQKIKPELIEIFHSSNL
jgi:hypothetical protein